MGYPHRTDDVAERLAKQIYPYAEGFSCSLMALAARFTSGQCRAQIHASTVPMGFDGDSSLVTLKAVSLVLMRSPQNMQKTTLTGCSPRQLLLAFQAEEFKPLVPLAVLAGELG